MQTKKPIIITHSVPVLTEAINGYFSERARAEEVFQAGKKEANTISRKAAEDFHSKLDAYLVDTGVMTAEEAQTKSRQFTWEDGVVFEVTPERAASPEAQPEAAATLN